jgi:hypothetical protein
MVSSAEAVLCRTAGISFIITPLLVYLAGTSSSKTLYAWVNPGIRNIEYPPALSMTWSSRNLDSGTDEGFTTFRSNSRRARYPSDMVGPIPEKRSREMGLSLNHNRDIETRLH